MNTSYHNMDASFIGNRSSQLIEAHVQQIVQEEERLRHLQQDVLNSIISQQMTSSRLQNRMPQGNLNRIDIERRNIMVLQEELRRQEEKKRAQEVLKATLEEQALLGELQQQAFLQNATKEYLAQLRELDQISLRQESFQNSNLFDGGFRSTSSPSCSNGFLNKQDLIQSALGQTQNFVLDAPSQFNPQNSMGAQPSVESNIFAQLDGELNTSSIFQSLGDCATGAGNMPFRLASSYGSDAHNNVQGMQNNIKLSGKNHLHSFNISAPRRQDRHKINPVHFFNNGSEVKYEGDLLSENFSKKRKALQEPHLFLKKEDYLASKPSTYKKQRAPPRKMSQGKLAGRDGGIKVTLPRKKNPMKLSKQLRSRIASENSESDPIKLYQERQNNAGPHSDLIVSKFTQNKKVDALPDKKCTQNNTTNREEEKLDAANVLLGLMKNGSP